VKLHRLVLKQLFLEVPFFLLNMQFDKESWQTLCLGQIDTSENVLRFNDYGKIIGKQRNLLWNSDHAHTTASGKPFLTMSSYNYLQANPKPQGVLRHGNVNGPNGQWQSNSNTTTAFGSSGKVSTMSTYNYSKANPKPQGVLRHENRNGTDGQHASLQRTLPPRLAKVKVVKPDTFFELGPVSLRSPSIVIERVRQQVEATVEPTLPVFSKNGKFFKTTSRTNQQPARTRLPKPPRFERSVPLTPEQKAQEPKFTRNYEFGPRCGIQNFLPVWKRPEQPFIIDFDDAPVAPKLDLKDLPSTSFYVPESTDLPTTNFYDFSNLSSPDSDKTMDFDPFDDSDSCDNDFLDRAAGGVLLPSDEAMVRKTFGEDSCDKMYHLTSDDERIDAQGNPRDVVSYEGHISDEMRIFRAIIKFTRKRKISLARLLATHGFPLSRHGAGMVHAAKLLSAKIDGRRLVCFGPSTSAFLTITKPIGWDDNLYRQEMIPSEPIICTSPVDCKRFFCAHMAKLCIPTVSLSCQLPSEKEVIKYVRLPEHMIPTFFDSAEVPTRDGIFAFHHSACTPYYKDFCISQIFYCNEHANPKHPIPQKELARHDLPVCPRHGVCYNCGANKCGHQGNFVPTRCEAETASGFIRHPAVFHQHEITSTPWSEETLDRLKGLVGLFPQMMTAEDDSKLREWVNRFELLFPTIEAQGGAISTFKAAIDSVKHIGDLSSFLVNILTSIKDAFQGIVDFSRDNWITLATYAIAILACVTAIFYTAFLGSRSPVIVGVSAGIIGCIIACFAYEVATFDATALLTEMTEWCNAVDDYEVPKKPTLADRRRFLVERKVTRARKKFDSYVRHTGRQIFADGIGHLLDTDDGISDVEAHGGPSSSTGGEIPSFPTRIIDFSVKFLKIPFSDRIARLNASAVLVRNIKHLCTFLATLLPTFLQEWIFTKAPSCVAYALYEASGWMNVIKEMRELEPSLKKPEGPDIIRTAKILLEKAEKMLNVHLNSSWALRATRDIREFKSLIREAEARYITVAAGHKPLMVYLAGPPGIGKTMIAQVAAYTAASVVANTKTLYGVYTRGAGKYMENFSNEKVLFYKDFVSGNMETKAMHIDEWWNAADGAFQPNAAALDQKGMVHDLVAVVGASNYTFPVGIDGFGDLEPLYRRRHIPVYVTLNRDFHLFAGKDYTIAQAMRVFKEQATAEDKKWYRHLSFKLFDPCYRNYGNVPFGQLNAGEGLRPLDIDEDFFHQHNADRNNFNAHVFLKYVQYRIRKENTLSEDLVINDQALLDAVLPPELILVQPYPVFDEKDEKAKTWHKVLGYLSGAILAASTLGAAIYGVYLMLRKSREETIEAQYGTQPRLLENIRRRKRVEAQAGPIETSPESIFNQRLNQAYVTVSYDNGVKANDNSGFMVSSDYLVTNYHFFLDSDGKFMFDQPFTLQYLQDGQPIEHHDVMSLSRLKFGNGGTRNDLVYYRLLKPLRGFRNISGFFADGDIHIPRETQVRRLGDDKVFIGKYGERRNILGYTQESLRDIPVLNTATYDIPGKPGDCGAPIVAHYKGRSQILGIHTGCRGNFSIMMHVDRKEAVEITKSSPEILDLPDTIAQGFLRDTIDTEKKSPIPNGTFAAVGTETKPKSDIMSSELRRTPFYNIDPARPTRVGITKKNFQLCIEMESKYGVNRPAMPDHLVTFGYQAAKRKFLRDTRLPRRELTWEEVGERIEKDKSVGYGWDCKRADLFIPGTNLLKPELIEKAEAILQSPEWPAAIIMPCLKDESTPRRKFDPKHPEFKGVSTRTFQRSSIEWLIIGVKTTGSFVDHIHENCLRTPSRVGMDPCSPDWDRWVTTAFKMRQSSEHRAVDLDYKKFETLVTWQFAEIYCKLMDDFYQNKDPNRRKYVYAMIDSYMVYGSWVWHRFFGNPSGMVGTVDINSVTNEVFQAAAFKYIFPQATVNDYVRLVSTNLYGDDSITVPSPLIEDDFNFFTLRDFLAKYEIEITPADKNAVPQKTLRQDELSFLKKRILFSEELNAYVPYVDWHTLLDQLSYARDTTREGLIQICDSALAFSFFRGNWKRNGQIPIDDPTFEQQRSFMRSVIGCDMADLVSYDELMNRYCAIRDLAPTFDYENEFIATI